MFPRSVHIATVLGMVACTPPAAETLRPNECARQARYRDADGDGFGDSLQQKPACFADAGYVAHDSDCDDADAKVHPAANEMCDGADNNCDGEIDENGAIDAATWYPDGDGDGLGEAAGAVSACHRPDGYVADDSDCDDTTIAVRPGAVESCNGIDDNCDGVVDEEGAYGQAKWYVDADGDGYGESSTYTFRCEAPAGYVHDATDCLDSDGTVYPGAQELCDGTDSDCDGFDDDLPMYIDADGDGLGAPDTLASECTIAGAGVPDGYDCDDGDPTEPIVVDVTNGHSAAAGTLADPYLRLQRAIDDATACVVAYPGTYEEALSITKSIDIWGVEGAETTIIDPMLVTCTVTDPSRCDAAISINSGAGATPTLHGFTVTGGTGLGSHTSVSTECADSSSSSGSGICTITTWMYCGGGIAVNGDYPRLYDLEIRDNLLPAFQQSATGLLKETWLFSFGGGICVVSGGVDIDSSTITTNFADQGGGIYGEGGAVINLKHSYVAENSAADGGGMALAGASADVENVVIDCNAAATDGGGLFTESSGMATFTNTVLYGNTSSVSGPARGAQAWIGRSTVFNLMNSIVEGDTSVAQVYGNGTGDLTWNNVYNASGEGTSGLLSLGEGSISAGGNFVMAVCDGDPWNDDFSLAARSSSLTPEIPMQPMTTWTEHGTIWVGTAGRAVGGRRRTTALPTWSPGTQAE